MARRRRDRRDPLPAAAGSYPPIRFLREGRWWRWMLDGTLRAAQASRGRYFVMPMWSPGRTMGFDCDISCMLSPNQFEEPPATSRHC